MGSARSDDHVVDDRRLAGHIEWRRSSSALASSRLSRTMERHAAGSPSTSPWDFPHRPIGRQWPCVHGFLSSRLCKTKHESRFVRVQHRFFYMTISRRVPLANVMSAQAVWKTWDRRGTCRKPMPAQRRSARVPRGHAREFGSGRRRGAAGALTADMVAPRTVDHSHRTPCARCRASAASGEASRGCPRPSARPKAHGGMAADGRSPRPRR